MRRGCRVVFLHFDKMFTRGNTEESMCIRAFDALSSPFIADEVNSHDLINMY